MNVALTIVLLLLSISTGLACAYLLWLTLLSWPSPRPPKSKPRLKFAVVVPAHNEEAGIASTVASLKSVDWPSELLQIVVVADNCTDSTAEKAAAAGAIVLVRQDENLRGKGYALAFAFARCLEEKWADAIAVVDADSVVSSNLLHAYASRLLQGEKVVQAHYGVRNPFDSWRTCLIAVAKGAFHILRSRARERLGVSCGIRGNGWCVSRVVLIEIPYRAFSLTEDLEYGLELGRRGIRVAYADEAHVDGDMVTSSAIAVQQRQRWEAGRFEMVRKYALKTLLQSMQRRSLIMFDLACDLLLLPLSYVVIGILLLFVVSAAMYALGGNPLVFVLVGGACLFALCMHVVRGWQLSGTGIRGLTALMHVPAYLVWRVVVMMKQKTTGWVRTERESQ